MALNQDQRQADLDAWVREVVQWHFDPKTGTPFWLERAKTLGFDPQKDVKTYADLDKFGFFEDEWLRGGRLTAALAFFDIEKENIAIPDQTGVTRQQGTIRSKGVEAELHATLGDGWFVSANYAFTDAKLSEFRELRILSQSPFVARLDDYSGNRVPFAPRNVFNFWTQREWKSGFGAAAGARYVCTQFIAEDNAFKIKEHWTFDAALSYKIKRATLRLNLKNLSDQEYTTRGFGTSSVIPANPFAIYGQVQVGVGSHQ